MSFIPEEELKGSQGVNLTPMIDFLFLMVVFFASLAVTRVTLRDTELELVKLKAATQSQENTADNETKLINISINAEGECKWVTEIHDYPMENAAAIAKELRTQHSKGLIPNDKKKTHVLLKIDSRAQWASILHVVFAIKEEGFDVRPVYLPEES